MKRFFGMALLAASALGGVVGCSGGGGNDAGADSATPTDGGADAMAMCNDAGLIIPEGDGGTCFRASSCDGMPFCPAQVTNTATTPNFVITQLDISAPAPLTAVGAIINNAIIAGGFEWGISLDLTAMTLRTGTFQQGVMPQPGTGLLTAQFSYFNGGAPAPGDANRWNPVMAPITVTGSTFSSMGMIALVTVPIYGDATMPGLLAELPLRNASMHDVLLQTGNNCIGLAKGTNFNSCQTNKWFTKVNNGMGVQGGTLEGDITVTDAQMINVSSLNTNLCAILAGTDCSMPQSAWAHPPDSQGGTAWHVVATFSAVSATVH